MMRSLWSGVSGLQSHQVAMDVEGNNIANVNTVGFKYSRTNFADLLSQTSKIATAPADPLGGKNSLQIGMGSTVSSVTHIFSQGSSQNTDKTTDMAIQGDGFFVVSGDGSVTNKFTRAGDFTFDAKGNFVDNNGYIAQGWLRDPVTKKIDATAPARNIVIDPGMTMPAEPSKQIQLKANLTSGTITNEMDVTYALDSSAGLAASEKTEDLGVLFNAQGKAFALQPGQGIWSSFSNATTTSGVVATDAQTLNIVLNGVSIGGSVGSAGSSAAQNAADIANLINSKTAQTGVSAAATSAGTVVLTNTNLNSIQTATDEGKNIAMTLAAGDTSGLAAATSVTAFKYTYTTGTSVANAAPTYGGTFKTTEDLRSILQTQAQSISAGAAVTVDSQGRYTVTNTSGGTLSIAITGIANTTVSESPLFSQTFAAMNGTLPTGTASKTAQAMNAATHASSIDIFDSLGSKHTMSFTFRKTSSNQWSWTATVPQPGNIGGIAPNTNVYTGGTVTFNSDGSLVGINPQSLNYTAGNGSKANQQVNLAFGTPNTFDGLTSFDAKSATSLISQDGYTGGDLQGVRIDQTGTLMGSFTNGRSFGLAQVAMARFANNEGLIADGGNIFLQSANSGSPTIGAADSGGRGFIQSQALEMSNVDLSRSLTELIVIQRGYQANSKTITTSDQLLTTLLGLKQ